MKLKNMRRAAAAILAVGGLSTSVALATGSSAMAATTGNLVVCAEGNYAGYVSLSAPGDSRQPPGPQVAYPGQQCQDIYFSPSVAAEFPHGINITAYGIYNVSRQPFQIGLPFGTFYPASQGVTIDLLGTSTSPSVYVH
jgi:hypothetical protein